MFYSSKSTLKIWFQTFSPAIQCCTLSKLRGGRETDERQLNSEEQQAIFSQSAPLLSNTWNVRCKIRVRSFKTSSTSPTGCSAQRAVSCCLQRTLITVTCRGLVTACPNRCSLPPFTPPPPIVRTTEANPLLLNTLPEADGHRPEDPSILNLTVGATCGLEVSSRQAVHLVVCSCCWMHLH